MYILELIKNIRDPRIDGKIRYDFGAIIFIALCAVLSGCESWNDIEEYGKVKKSWLGKYVDLSNGIPSEWTFRRIFTLLDPEQIENLLRTHARSIVEAKGESKQIAIDGKALRGSKRQDLRCLQSISAWCQENKLVLAERQVMSKSNEITAIPLLLETLELKGNTVTIDAIGCQKNNTRIIKEKGGDYVLGLKRNQAKLYQAATKYVEEQGENEHNRLHDAFDSSHGRTIRRRYFGYDISSLEQVKDFAGAKTVIAVENISTKDNDPTRVVTANWRYYLSSHKCTDKDLPNYIRSHWSIENKLHWILDVNFKEDNDQKAERKSARSFAILRRIALNIVRQDQEKEVTLKRKKRSLRGRLKNCGWSDDYLLSLLLS